ncbi:guanine nucleotide exchange C9orf72 [Lingula anatina]|uniref:Guanine nucleotide exchange C9orf72 n=1 Tax=Lingula anatina TaxID=7574 RepID=A0A1S3JU23_LINAN|nr:guanine nucleotide exchange C9orf72 [Lingula anatina]|eukprot:XP_013413828.1 guanine nucleotide exchange C9orf72 [Lingula anatina]
MNLSLVYATLQRVSSIDGQSLDIWTNQSRGLNNFGKAFKNGGLGENGSECMSDTTFSSKDIHEDIDAFVSSTETESSELLSPMSLSDHAQENIPSTVKEENSTDKNQHKDHADISENSECDSGFADSLIQAKSPEKLKTGSYSDKSEIFSGGSLERENNVTIRQFPECASKLFRAVVVSCWDNICGPRIMRTWLANDFKIQDDRLLEICRKSLVHELDRDEGDGSINMKSFTVSKEDFTAMTYIFNGMTKLGIKVHGITFLLHNTHIRDFFSCLDLIKRYMQRLVGSFRILLEKTDGRNKALTFFDDHIPKLVEISETMERFAIPEAVALTATYLSHQHRLSFSKEELLKDAIMSHLLTCGNTLVTGSSEKRINKMILTLALFSQLSDRRCSRLVAAAGEKRWNRYIPDLCIQGLLMPKITSEAPKKQFISQLPHHDILCSYYPTTIVDISGRNVWQTYLVDGHKAGRQRLLNRELLDLALDKKRRTVIPMVTLFCPDQPETLVTNFVKEVFQLPPNSRHDYTVSFVYSLKRQAMLLIRRIEAIVLAKRPGKPNVMRLREEMRLENEGDFRIILAQAEKLKPGFYSYIIEKTDFSQYALLQGYTT